MPGTGRVCACALYHTPTTRLSRDASPAINDGVSMRLSTLIHIRKNSKKNKKNHKNHKNKLKNRKKSRKNKENKKNHKK